jgi:tRNA (adenine22-N1)-methyltransferase
MPVKLIELSPRLSCIITMITEVYDDIWDTCCDHGLLGFALLQRHAASRVHFVDQVPEIMSQLTDKLRRFAAQDNWQVHCTDVTQLHLSDSARQLIVIAGVGGDKIIELVSAIVASHPKHNLEFILCPVHHNYTLRQHLIALGFSLIDEQLVAENKRYYEVLHIAKTGPLALTVTGSLMWDLNRRGDQDYLKLTIAHYSRKARGGDKQASAIVADYTLLEENLGI